MALNPEDFPATYSFRIKKVDGWKVKVNRKGENPEFNISDELRNAVYENFPYDATVEEKAIFIYYKLCKLMNYDSNYMYDLKFNELKNYNSEFDKEKYENMKPGDSIVCWDFARLYEKFVNELGENIEGITYSYGEKTTSHWECGFYTDKISVLLNPVEPRGDDGITDLARLKLGVWPQAISPDTHMTPENMNFLSDILDDMFTRATGVYAKDILAQVEIPNDVSETFTAEKNEPPNYSIEEISDLIKEKNNCEKANIPTEMEVKIQAILKMFENHNLHGNEALVTFMAYDSKLQYFGPNTQSSIVWDMSDAEKNKSRQLLIRSKESTDIFAIDFEELCAGVLTMDKLQELLEQGSIIYENNDYKIDR